jgi:hypothetical protein
MRNINELNQKLKKLIILKPVFLNFKNAGFNIYPKIKPDSIYIA